MNVPSVGRVKLCEVSPNATLSRQQSENRFGANSLPTLQ